MDNLVVWLRQQLEDDEKTAKAVRRLNWQSDNRIMADRDGAGVWVLGDDGDPVLIAQFATAEDGDGIDPRTIAAFSARHDPAAVLADVEAKRAVLDEYESAVRFYAENASPMTPDVETRGLGTAIQMLARAYRHRPGWKQEWET